MDSITDITARWFVTSDLVTREVGGQAFILMPDSSMHILENDSAVFLFRAFQEAGADGVSVAQLSAALERGFEVDQAQAQHDVRRFVHDLVELKIVQPIS